MFDFEDKGLRYKNDYPRILKDLRKLKDKGDEVSTTKAIALLRKLCRTDLFFLMYFILEVKIINDEWVVDRINEVEELHEDTLDLWPREHCKSTILTYGLIIQEIINNAEERVVIFSHTRAQAKKFLRRIKQTIEQNTLLLSLFQDIFYENPKSAPKWSEDEGLVVKRRGRFAEATLEAWGLVDGMPTGGHYTIRVYDDMVTEKSVGTPEQMKKLKESFELSHNLGARGGSMRVIGTIYHFMDLHNEMAESGEWTVRLLPAEDKDGHGVHMTDEELAGKRKRMGSWVYAAQMMLNPTAKGANMFDAEDLQYYEQVPPVVKKIILCDPANTKKASSDYTVFVCLGVDPYKNYYLLDMVRDKMILKEKWTALHNFMLRNGCSKAYYEKHGAGWTDIQYYREKMQEDGIYFTIQEISNQYDSKSNRIQQLQPIIEEHKFYIPKTMSYRTITGKRVDLVYDFKADELSKFPFCKHDDMLDCIANMKNEEVLFIPPVFTGREQEVKEWNPLEDQHSVTWMSF